MEARKRHAPGEVVDRLDRQRPNRPVGSARETHVQSCGAIRSRPEHRPSRGDVADNDAVRDHLTDGPRRHRRRPARQRGQRCEQQAGPGEPRSKLGYYYSSPRVCWLSVPRGPIFSRRRRGTPKGVTRSPPMVGRASVAGTRMEPIGPPSRAPGAAWLSKKARAPSFSLWRGHGRLCLAWSHGVGTPKGGRRGRRLSTGGTVIDTNGALSVP